MLGFFVKSGDQQIGAIFESYIWGSTGIKALLDPLRDKRYGSGLALVLIQFYVEGKFPVFGPEKLSVGRYSPKERAIAVKVPVTRCDFHDRSDEQRREFIMSALLSAIEAIRPRVERKKLDVDLDRLKADVKAIGTTYVHLAAGPSVG